DRDADPSLAVEVKLEVDRLLETLAREYLRSADLDAVDTVIHQGREAFEAVGRSLGEGDAYRRKPQRSERADLLVAAGLEPALAHELAAAADLAMAPDVASVASAVGRSPSGVAGAFLVLGQALSFERLHRLLDTVQPPNQWARWQLRGLVDDLRALHRAAAQRALNEHPDRIEHDAVERFLDARRGAIQRSTRIIRQAEEDAEASRLDAVSVAMPAVRNALDHRP
ncbi:MAG: NAD-glutamate dehydrogenase, partial [Actinomycetota bacterium]|nr:NAD-glutamate dehydrogenase [Actinomycetota bacterium]